MQERKKTQIEGQDILLKKHAEAVTALSSATWVLSAYANGEAGWVVWFEKQARENGNWPNQMKNSL